MTIDELFNISKGKKPPELFDSPSDGSIPFIKIEGIRNAGSYQFCAQSPNLVTCNHDDVLIVWDGAYCGLTGFGLEGAIGSTLARLRPKSKEVFGPYAGHFLKSKFKEIQENATGAAIPHINGGHLRRMEIPLPSLDEQKRIAAVLDQADVLRRRRWESLQFTENLLQSVFIDMFGDLDANPHNWEIIPLGNLVADGDTINYGVVQPGSDFASGIPLIRLGDLASPDPQMSSVKRIAPSIEESFKRSRLVGGEVLIGCVGHTIGVSCIAPKEWAGSNIARAVARVNLKPGIAPEFIVQQIRTSAIQHYFRGERRIVGQPTLNIKQIKETPILLPPAELRDRFALFYRSTLNSHADKEKSNKLLELLFSSVQQRAFRGELNLSKVKLSAEGPKLAEIATQPAKTVDGIFHRPGYFPTPLELETEMQELEYRLDAGPGDSIPWNENFFKYRILSQVLRAPYTFKQIWDEVYGFIEEADYEIVKDKVFEYLEAGTLRQHFCKKSKEIVFFPKRK